MAISYTEAYIEGYSSWKTTSVSGLSHDGIGPGTINVTNETKTSRVYFFIENQEIVQGRAVSTWEIAPTDPVTDESSEARATTELQMKNYANRVYSIAPKLQEINVTIFFTGQETSDHVPGLPDGRNRFFEMVNGPFSFGWQGKLKLKLPDHDEVTVMPGVFRSTINRQRRNIEYVTGTFYVVPEGNKTGVSGGATADKSEKASEAADDLPKKTQTASITAWSESENHNAPAVVASDVSTLSTVSSSLSSVLAKMKTVEDSITTPLARAQENIRGLVDNVESLINEPSKIFTSLYNSCASIVSSIKDVGSQIESQYAIIDGVLTGFGSIFGDTDTNKTAKGHAATIETCLDACALANIGNKYTEYDFPTQDDALDAIQRFREASDSILSKLETDGTPDISGNIRDLTGAVIDYLVSEAANLPNVSEVQVPDQIPVIATCFEQYGDVSEGHISDIINRNNIRNANFPPRELQILKTL